MDITVRGKRPYFVRKPGKCTRTKMLSTDILDYFDLLLTVRLSIIVSIDRLNTQILVFNVITFIASLL